MRLITASGTFRTAGRQVGSAILHDIRFALRGTLRLFRESGLTDLDRLRSVTDAHVRRGEAECGQAIDYLRGMALGAGVNFDDFALLAFSEELLALADVEAGKCSTFAVPTSRGWVIGHNEDFYGFYLGRMHVVDLRILGCPRTFMLNYPGHQGCSLSEAGLALTNNSFMHPPAEGASKNLKHFLGALSDDADAAVKLLAGGTNALATHYTLGWGPRDGLLSVTVGHPAVGEGLQLTELGRSRPFCHANHALHGRLQASDPAPSSGGTSVRRLDRLRAVAASPDRPRDPEAMLGFLSTRDGLLHRHEGPDDLGLTLASAVIRPGTGELWIRDADPSADPRDLHLTFGTASFG